MKLLLILLISLALPVAEAFTKNEVAMLQRAQPYIHTVVWAHDTAWPDAPMRSFVAAQIEKESRWDPSAELCVPKPTCSRERGLGFAQFTITAKFNAFQEVSQMHPLLRGWRPEEYKNPEKQILAAVVKDRGHYKQCTPLMSGIDEVMACVASSYNGGYGGFSADRRLCSNTKGCDPKKWFGNVANTSLKAKTALSGYGQSFFSVNRGYAAALVVDYRKKYIPLLGS